MIIQRVGILLLTLMFISIRSVSAAVPELPETVLEAVKHYKLKLPEPQEYAGVFAKHMLKCYDEPFFKGLVLLYYPQGFSTQTDAAILESAAKLFQREQGNTEDERRFSSERSIEIQEQYPGFSYSALNYSLHKPNSAYVSLVWTGNFYSGGAHPSWQYSCLTVQTDSGRILGLSDFFPHLPLHEQTLLAVIAKAVAEQKKNNQQTSLPFGRKEADLKPERLSISPEALVIWYSPYELGSFAEGDFIISIPKNDALKLGANPALWQP